MKQALGWMDFAVTFGKYLWMSLWEGLNHAGEALSPFRGVVFVRRMLGVLSLAAFVLLVIVIVFEGMSCYPRRNAVAMILIFIATLVSWGA